jgi:uncharacterized membrane protein YqgA involved in biofilm formation
MSGTILNALGILIGGIVGLTTTKELSPARQSILKIGLGALTVFVGLQMTVLSLRGSFLAWTRQLVIVVLAMMVGKIIGRMLRLQIGLNQLGKFAKERLAQARPDNPQRVSDGLTTCAILFCMAPIAIFGALADGMENNWKVLAIKAVMDGLAMMAFVKSFGWGALLAVIPVVAYQGTISICAHSLAPYLQDHALLAPLTATLGLLVFSVALIILEIKKVELADYLPSLAVAPLIALFWQW